MTNRLAVVPATYVKFSTMVDGTLRVVLDIEPKNMADAIGLFSKPGAPVAVARLTDSAAVAADRETDGPIANTNPYRGPQEMPRLPGSPASERKPTSLASKVAMTVEREDFQSFLQCDTAYLEVWRQAMARLNARGALDYCSNNRRDIVEEAVKLFCGVERKRDIIAGTPAGERWQDLWFQFTHSGQGRAA